MNHQAIRGPRAASRTLIAALAITFLLAACGSDEQSLDTTASPAAASIDVSSVWARTSPMVAAAGAVYMTIDNTGGLGDALIGVSVDPSIAKTAELHETVAVVDEASTSTMAGGMTTAVAGESMLEMRPVDRIVVPAQGSVALAPGGYHIMMMDLVEPLTVGSTLNVTLTFEASGDQVVTASVRDTAP
jgi:periplasmic copper chaperone A